MRKSVVVILLSISIASLSLAFGEGVNARDCVMTRYISGVWMSPEGGRVAYLVKTPDLERNTNNYELYARAVDGSSARSTPLISGVGITDIKWLADGRHLSMLVAIETGKQLVVVDSITGTHEPVIAVGNDIDSYTMDRSAKTIVYTVEDSATNVASGPHGSNQQRMSSGYVVQLDNDTGETSLGDHTYSLYVRHKSTSGAWSSSEQIAIENPFTHAKVLHIPYARYLSLSPDGSKLLLNFLTSQVPEEWRSDPAIKSFGVSRFEIMVKYELQTGTTTLGFRSPFPSSVPLWSGDSRSYFVNAHSPVGSQLEAEDLRAHRSTGADANLFEVTANSGELDEVLRYVPYHHDGPLALQPNGDVVVRTGWTTVARLRRIGTSWQEVGKISLPEKDGRDLWLYLTSNGSSIVGVHETVTTPEDLFSYQSTGDSIQLLTNLNPQLKNIQFAPVEKVQWATPDGLKVKGLLFIPTNYVSGTRYPLVIQTKGDQGWFTCDSGITHEPSFAPQPLANAGIAYLVQTTDENYNFQNEIDSIPKGYPGNIGEAVLQMNIWDSAIDMLAQRGLVDPEKVGIIGFSRTGWQVEFDLVHARHKFAAATAADNVQYSFSEYSLYPPYMDDFDQMYGGPPYGAAFTNWTKYSISFNLDKIHTPLLMEEMGHGTRDEVQGSIPLNLAVHYEVARGLARLGKPAELYYYPDEIHQPDHPKARLASVQRNVDWYRFWLQGYERPNPEDPEQYKRWERLRNLRDADQKASENPVRH